MDLDFGGNLGASGLLQGSVRRIPTLGGSQNGQLVTPINFTSDFEFEAEFSTADIAVNMALLADTTAGQNYLTVSPNQFGYGIRGAAGAYVGLTLNDGKVHTGKLHVVEIKLE